MTSFLWNIGIVTNAAFLIPSIKTIDHDLILVADRRDVWAYLIVVITMDVATLNLFTAAFVNMLNYSKACGTVLMLSLVQLF